MTTSGSIDFSVSRDDIIEEALMRVGVLPEGGIPTADQLTDHSRTLNIMVKAWVGRGINIWAVDKVTLFLTENKHTYTAGTDRITLTSGVTRTALAAAVVASATTITVDSITGISSTYKIGIELDDGTLHWDVVNGAPSGTTVTLTTGLGSSATASTDGVVYVYASAIAATRIKSVLEVVRRQSDLSDVPINIVPRRDYWNLGSKTSDGKVNQIWVEPQLSATIITTYPQPDDETETLEMLCKRTLEDFDAAGDTPDFPQEYYEALYMGLAARLSPKYRLPMAERQYLDMRAEEALTSVEGWDREQNVSLYLQPNYWGRMK